MAKKKTILFVMPRLPFPATSGRKTSLYHYCRILSEELGYRLVVAAFLEAGDDPSQKPAFIDRLVILPKESAKKKILGIAKNSIILQKKPLQVELYWSKTAKEKVNQLMNEENPEIVIGDMIRSTEYIRDLKAYRIADLDDRISLRYQRQLDVDIKNVNPYGAFLNTMPAFVQKVLLAAPIKAFVLKTEVTLLKKYESDIGKSCDKTIFVAENEVEQFNRELGKEKAVAIPIGVDTQYFSYRETGKQGNYIGFLGALGVAHNESAVRNFVENILPLIVKKCPDVTFLVIGGGASNEIKSLESKNVHFTGRVDDVREYLEKCKVFVCPMTFGSGIKTKNLEAMAMGLPVVTSSIGAENIDAADGKDWIVRDDNQVFADSVVEILENRSLQNKLGKNASEFVKEHFTWDVAEKEFKKLLYRI